jgi:dTDP-4-dehydrorhamnose reductase
MVLKNILLTGGSGILGTEMRNLKKDLLYPSSKEMDIEEFSSVNKFFKNNDIQMVIHSAAYTDVALAEKEFEKTIDINIIGTYNILKNCIDRNIKMVYISTDYVFDGNKGSYSVDEPVNPLTKYAKSKTSAELMVRMYDNSLCIRTSFCSKDFPHDKAMIDQWTTKDYVDVMAPKILKECLSDKKGVTHCYSKKRTVYELASMRKPYVAKIQRKDIKSKIPKDTSLC